jgi:hypothetical protein
VSQKLPRKSLQFSLLWLLLVITALPFVVFASNFVFAVTYQASRAITPDEEQAKRYFAPFNCVVFFVNFAARSIPGLRFRIFPWRIILNFASMLGWFFFAYFFSLPKSKYFPNLPRADVLRQNFAFRVLGWLPFYLTIYFVFAFALMLGFHCEKVLDVLLLPIGWPIVAKNLDLKYLYWHLLLFVGNAVIWCIAAEFVTWCIRRWRNRPVSHSRV